MGYRGFSFWVSMGVYAVLGVCGFLWVFMGVCGFVSDFFMGFYGCLWDSGCLWVFMGVFGFLGVCQYLWMFMGVYECLRGSICVYECL